MSSNARKLNTSEEEIHETLGELSFFEQFPELLVKELVDLTEFVEFETGAEILKQGQLNSTLFFLLSGKVGVYVDDKLVTHLARKGEVVGEMSVITNSPCGATIVAETPVEAYAVDAMEFHRLTGGNQDRFLHTLYRVYANILTERLQATNQKAKQIEELNVQLMSTQNKLREINMSLEKEVQKRTAALQSKTQDLMRSHQRLEQQNTALLVSHKKIEELYSTREVTFEKLEILYKDHLLPLHFSLEGLRGNLLGNERKTLEQSIQEVNQVIELIEPITNRYRTDRAMKSKSILFCDGNKKQQVVAKMALGGTGCRLEVSGSLEDARLRLDESTYDIVFLDQAMLELNREIRALSPQSKLVFVTDDPIPVYLPSLLKMDELPNIVSRDSEDKTFSIKNILTTVGKLTSGDIFGLDKYLSWGVDVKSVPVTNSDKRGQLVEEMDAYFTMAGMRRSNRDRCKTVVEELLMNAIYDAPQTPEGRPLYNHLGRKAVIELKPEHQGQLKYATDGMLMAVSVEDPFGGLKGHTILKYLESCYVGRELSEQKEKGGAGRGIHQIVENADLVVFNISPGRKTEVVALFNVDPRGDGLKSPSFHLFIQ